MWFFLQYIEITCQTVIDDDVLFSKKIIVIFEMEQKSS